MCALNRDLWADPKDLPIRYAAHNGSKRTPTHSNLTHACIYTHNTTRMSVRAPAHSKLAHACIQMAVRTRTTRPWTRSTSSPPLSSPCARSTATCGWTPRTSPSATQAGALASARRSAATAETQPAFSACTSLRRSSRWVSSTRVIVHAPVIRMLGRGAIAAGSAVRQKRCHVRALARSLAL